MTSVSTETLSVSMVYAVLNHARLQGYDPLISIERMEFETQLLRDPNQRMHIHQADALFNDIAQAIDQPEIGISAGVRLEGRSYTLLQPLFMCSSSLREALTLIRKYFILISDETPPLIELDQQGLVRVSFEGYQQSYSTQHCIRQELITSAFCQWSRLLCGREFSISRVDLCRPQPVQSDIYQYWLGAPVHFGCQKAAVYFPAFWLDKQLHQTNPHIMEMIKKEVKTLADRIQNRGSLTERIKQALDQKRIAFSATQQEVAELFHISSRTLNRHLQQEGTSLKTILTQSRIETAKQLLTENKLSIEQIAMKIGFSGRRTLDRIFIKHLGMSPAQYRNKIRSENTQPIAVPTSDEVQPLNQTTNTTSNEPA